MLALPSFPEYFRFPMSFTLEQLVDDACHERGAKQIRAAGRLMTMLDDRPHLLPDLFRVMASRFTTPPHPRMLLGITGAPGAGKSTLTDALIGSWRTLYPDRKVGVVAVDPSSPFTGGAVLGDRVRMMRHATDPNVFVRSLATRGHLGGLTLGVKGVVQVLAMIGCDLVIIETVGVGQSEVEVAKTADHVFVVLAPGHGDTIQMLKAGLMEIADDFVINKANREGTNTLHSQLLQTLTLGASSPSEDEQSHHQGELEAAGVDPAMAELGMHSRGGARVFLVSATNRTGTDELAQAMHATADEKQAVWAERRTHRLTTETVEAIVNQAHELLLESLGRGGPEMASRILTGGASVEALAKELVAKTCCKFPLPSPV